MFISQQIRNNTMYYFFLRGVQSIIQYLPVSCGRYILMSAKYFIAVLPLVYLAFMSLMSILAQYSIGSWFVSRKLEQKQAQIDQLEARVSDEADERAVMQRSSELLMECIKTLQKKLDTEIVTRRTYQYESEKDKQIHMKKIECIESRVDRLKANLKKGILGMDRVLQGIHAGHSGGDCLPSKPIKAC